MANEKLFREYIGAQFREVSLDHVGGFMIDRPDMRFDLILAFAVDYERDTTDNNKPKPKNGVFSPFWYQAHLSPEQVRQFKEKHRNARVMVSLGGDSLDEITKVVFTPLSVDSWVENAVATLTTIINDYHLDGVDINYENFDRGVGDEATFVECIGQLLTKLRAAPFPKKMVTSIAPFGQENELSQAYYQKLWNSQYRSMIDYVNFQFYGCGQIDNADTYVEVYDRQVRNYPGSKVLASFQTGGLNLMLTPRVALDAARLLKGKNKLPGLFIWSADSSMDDNNGFKHEIEAQQIVAGNP